MIILHSPSTPHTEYSPVNYLKIQQILVQELHGRIIDHINDSWYCIFQSFYVTSPCICMNCWTELSMVDQCCVNLINVPPTKLRHLTQMQQYRSSPPNFRVLGLMNSNNDSNLLSIPSNAFASTPCLGTCSE